MCVCVQLTSPYKPEGAARPGVCVCRCSSQASSGCVCGCSSQASYKPEGAARPGVCVCACKCACVCVHMCVRVCVCVHVLILPRQIIFAYTIICSQKRACTSYMNVCFPNSLAKILYIHRIYMVLANLKHLGWPEACMHAVHDGMFAKFPANFAVYTPYIYRSGQP